MMVVCTYEARKVMRPRKMMVVCTYEARKVALRPPKKVYSSVRHGMMNEVMWMSMSATADMTEQPPSRSMDETMMLVARPKKRKTKWAVLPQRTLTISRKVCALGARRLTSMARMPKMSTWMEAPEAYQKGPVMPYCQATLEDWRRVAAHVHCDTITDAVRPVLISRPAVLNCSEVVLTLANFFSSMESARVRRVRPMPKEKRRA